MKYITAFFMAWGNFLKIPCPVKKWDSKLNKLMLGFLPSIGAIVGVILAAVVAAMILIEPQITSSDLRALVVFVTPMLLAGFIHLDGFMDVNDAVLSRRDLAERQRILKDSSTGAFAVITLVILMIAYFAGIKAVLDLGIELPIGTVFVIPIVSRGVAGLDVLTNKKIEVSQYAKDEKTNAKDIGVIVCQLILYIAIGMAIAHSKMASVVIVAAVEVIAAMLFGGIARKQLGGMNGDIAGYEIVLSECFGIIALAVCMSLGV